MYFSEEYRRECEQLHRLDPTWGNGPRKRIRRIFKWFNDEKITGPVLDYGCGKAKLSRIVDVTITNYDPMVPEYSDLPNPHDFVICCDVLEHIEPAFLDQVLQHLFELTQVQCFLYVSGVPARETLPDGRNAHLIQEDWIWWAMKLNHYFEIESLENNIIDGKIVGTTFILGKINEHTRSNQ